MAAKNHIEDNEERSKQERAKTKQRVAGRSKKKKKKNLIWVLRC
ncbi:hypothetical protein QG37_00161 [Candidozyma auris]|nr:hypothetical protein QG37_00161 [[Candida] auris]